MEKFPQLWLPLLGVALGSIVYYLVLQVVIWLGVDTDLLKLLSAAVVAVSWRSPPGREDILRVRQREVRADAGNLSCE